MAVYVDNMRARYGRMIMCHMIADSTEELHQIARTIGVKLKWVQRAGTAREHFDICRAKRRLALDAGAIEITQRQCAQKLRDRTVHQEVVQDFRECAAKGRGEESSELPDLDWHDEHDGEAP